MTFAPRQATLAPMATDVRGGSPVRPSTFP
jgi:hypothetical protein